MNKGDDRVRALQSTYEVALDCCRSFGNSGLNQPVMLANPKEDVYKMDERKSCCSKPSKGGADLVLSDWI